MKYSLQQQVHFNGNIFGNKCCHCKKGSLYNVVMEKWRTLPQNYHQVLLLYKSYGLFYLQERWWSLAICICMCICISLLSSQWKCFLNKSFYGKIRFPISIFGAVPLSFFYYIQSNEIWRIINEIKCIFRKNYIFTSENIKLIFSLLWAVKNIRSGTTFFLFTLMVIMHEWKFECFYYTRWKFLWYSLKKSKFSFYFIVYMPMCVSDVITNVTKQNMNVMALTLSA